MRSRVIESKYGALRLTLNGAENARTFAGQFISRTFGSGVQHVAFTTDDIFASGDRLAQSGFKSLAITQNYYDDLQARFALADEVIARLAAHNILYDRDAGGEFFQIYSPNYKEDSFSRWSSEAVIMDTVRQMRRFVSPRRSGYSLLNPDDRP